MEITRTPNTNGTVDTCTLEDGYGFQRETHNFVRREIAFQITVSDDEDGTHGFAEAIFKDHSVVSSHTHGRSSREVKAELREWVSDVAFPELNTRPRYGTPEWERDAEAFELAQAETEFHGR